MRERGELSELELLEKENELLKRENRILEKENKSMSRSMRFFPRIFMRSGMNGLVFVITILFFIFYTSVLHMGGSSGSLIHIFGWFCGFLIVKNILFVYLAGMNLKDIILLRKRILFYFIPTLLSIILCILMIEYDWLALAIYGLMVIYLFFKIKKANNDLVVF